MDTINNSTNSQWTQNYVENFNNQFNEENKKLEYEKNSYQANLEKIYYISPHIYDLFESNKISLNTAKLKAKNLYNSFNKSQKNRVAKRLLELKINKSFDMNKLNLFNPVF